VPEQYRFDSLVGAPVIPTAAKTEFAYRETQGRAQLEWQLPWDSLPLANTLQVDRIYLQIERCDQTRRCTSLFPIKGNSTMLPLELRLSSPRQYRLTQCDLPLIGMYRNFFYAGFFRPSTERIVHDVIAMAEPFGGYFRGPDQHRRSPELSRYRYSETKIADAEFICGPLVAYRNKAELKFAIPALNNLPKLTDRIGQLSPDPKPLVVKPVDARWVLIMEPSDFTLTSTGEGQGGGEATEIMTLWLLDRHTAEFKHLRSVIGFESCQKGMEIESFEISDDLRRLKILSEPCNFGMPTDPNNPELKTTSLCFDRAQREYRECKPGNTQ
jgi:hypothetical protein